MSSVDSCSVYAVCGLHRPTVVEGYHEECNEENVLHSEHCHDVAIAVD